MGWARVGNDLRFVAAVTPHLLRHPADATVAWQWVSGRDSRLVAARAPWWPRNAIARVLELLPKDANVFEYGGGGSTLWLEDRGARVTTVEHDGAWAETLRGRISHRTVLHYEPPSATGTLTSDSADGYFDSYVRTVGEGPYDLVVVDGRCRVACVAASMAAVRPGGLLLLDDSDRPKYAEAHELLQHWDGEHLRGLKRGARTVVQTSVWVAPARSR